MNPWIKPHEMSPLCRCWMFWVAHKPMSLDVCKWERDVWDSNQIYGIYGGICRLLFEHGMCVNWQLFLGGVKTTWRNFFRIWDFKWNRIPPVNLWAPCERSCAAFNEEWLVPTKKSVHGWGLYHSFFWGDYHDCEKPHLPTINTGLYQH